MRLAAILLGLVSLGAAPPDRWVRIRAPHFELFTTAPARGGLDLVRYLEQVRTFFLKAFALAGPDARPVRLVLFRSEREFEPYRPTEIADAYFRAGIDHDYIVMKGGGDLDATAVHEYTHLLVRQTRLDVPQWLNEGLAELYSNLAPVGGRIVVGRPIASRVRALAREPWIDLRAVVGAAPVSGEKDRAAMFYAESWALIHMLSLDDRYSPWLRAMLDALRDNDTAAAFEKVYGKPVERVQADLEAYIHGNFLNTAVFDLEFAAGAPGEGGPSVEPNASLPARLALAELLSNDHNSLEEAARAYRALARDYENRWEAEQGWGEFCVRERRNEEAVRHFTRAAGLGCDDARMYLAYARVLNLTNRPADAIAALRTSLRIDPALDDAHFELAVTLVHGGSYRDAVGEFHRIHKLGPEYAYRYFYNLAVAHSHLGDRLQARRLIEKARAETRNPEENADLDRLLHSLDKSQ